MEIIGFIGKEVGLTGHDNNGSKELKKSSVQPGSGNVPGCTLVQSRA